MHLPKPPPRGVWVPAITFFNHETDTLDIECQTKYFEYLSKSGLAGLVVLGTNAEAFLLTSDERKRLIECARQACGPKYPIMAGVSGHSTKQTLEFIEDAVVAGANYALVLPPSYYGKQTTAIVINNFYSEIAEKSRLPMVIYNLPAVCNNIDLDSATIAKLAKTHANIVGVKLTCCSVAKVTRLAAELTPDVFSIYGGQSDALIGTLAAGAVGTIAGFANVFPGTIATIYNLHTRGRLNEAMELHKKVALAEQHCKSGPASVKYAVAITLPESAGIKRPLDGLRPRRPYIEPEEETKRVIKSQVAPLVDIEASLRQGAHAWYLSEAHRQAVTEPEEHWAMCYNNGNKV